MKDIESRLRLTDARKFKKAEWIINEMTLEQARFALTLINEDCRGFLGMPWLQRNFISNIRKAIKVK